MRTGTTEGFCGFSSARKQRNGRARTDDDCVKTARVQVPKPVAQSMAPATCIVRSSSTCAPTYGMAVAPPRRGQGDHSRVPTDSSPARRMRTGEGVHTYLTVTSPPGVSRPASHVLHIVRANGCCSGVVASCAIAVPPRSYVNCTAPV